MDGGSTQPLHTSGIDEQISPELDLATCKGIRFKELHQEKQGGHASRNVCGAAEVPKKQYRSERHPRVPYSRKLTF